MARAESTARLRKARPPSPFRGFPTVELAAPMPAPVPAPVAAPKPAPMPAPLRAATPAASPGCAAVLVPVPAVVRGGDEALRARTIERDVLLSAALPSPSRSARHSEPVPRKADSGESPSRRAAASTASAASPPPAHVQRRPHGQHMAYGAMAVSGSPFAGWDADDPPLSAWGEPSSLPRSVTRPLPLSPPLPLSSLSPMRLPPRSALLGHPGRPVFTPVDSPPEFRVTRRHAATPSAAAPASNVSEAAPTVLVEPPTAGVVADRQLGAWTDRSAGCNSAVEALRAAAGSGEEAGWEEAEREDAEKDAAAALIQNAAASDNSQAEKDAAAALIQNAAAGDNSQAETDAAAAMLQNAAASSLPTRFSRKGR